MTITTTTEVLLISKTGPFNSKYSGKYYRLTWLDVDTNTEYESTIATDYETTKMKNYSRWKHIVESDDYLGVYDGLTESKKTTNTDKQVISADSKPSRKLRLSQQQLDEVLEGLKEYQAPTTFQKIFTIITK